MELKRFINAFSEKLSLETQEAKVEVTPIDLLFGLKEEELKQQELDFDFTSFKQQVFNSHTKGLELTTKEIGRLL